MIAEKDKMVKMQPCNKLLKEAGNHSNRGLAVQGELREDVADLLDMYYEPGPGVRLASLMGGLCVPSKLFT